MEIILYVILWLLLGFLAAWVDHKYVWEGKQDTPLGLVMIVSIGGVVSLLVAVFSIKRLNLNFNVFKAKEPK